MKPMTDDNSTPDDDEDVGGGEAEFEITDEVERVYRALKSAPDAASRASAMVALAETFARGHDFTDYTATDDWHGYIEEYEQDKLRFDRSALRLGRLLANTLDEFFGETAEVTPKPPKAKLN